MGLFVGNRPRSWNRAALALLVASLASPAGSLLFAQVADAQPPWAVEAPGAAGARNGIGLDLFSERQESLQITFMEQSIQARDLLTGTAQGEVVRTDPGLLNRKFNFRFDLKGVGIEPAVALRLPGALGLHPTLVLQAAVADVSLDFLDRNRPQDSSSLGGRGPLFGAGLDLTRSLCQSCPWFAGASYFFQRLPNLTVDRFPHFALPGFDVLDDEVRLGRDIQEVSTRVGYGVPGSPIVSYLGVRHRWNDVKIEDRLQYRDPFQSVDTSLASRTQLKSEVTLALAGLEARLGPRLYGRLETSVGGGDRGVFLRMVYLGQKQNREPPPPPPVPPGDRAKVKKLESIAHEIGPRIAEIEVRFLADWKKLTVVEGADGQPAYLVRELEALLGRTETDILAVLVKYPELEALGDWVRDEFRRARIIGGLSTDSVLTASPAPRAPTIEAIVAALGLPNSGGYKEDLRLAKAGSATISEPEGDKVRGSVQETTSKLNGAVRMHFHAQITFVTPLGKDYSLTVIRRLNSTDVMVLPPGQSYAIGVGSYSWKFVYNQRTKLLFGCDGNDPRPPGRCPLEIIQDPCVVLTCSSSSCQLTTEACH